jgi:HSP20 family protein
MIPTLLNGSAQANRVASLIDRFFDNDFTPAPTWSAAPLAMWEDEQNVFVEMDAPGVAEADIDVTFHHGELVIVGERKAEQRANGHDTRRYGRFGQRITLSVPVDVDKVSAKLANGVLAVTLPKSEAAKPRRIALGN